MADVEKSSFNDVSKTHDCDRDNDMVNYEQFFTSDEHNSYSQIFTGDNRYFLPAIDSSIVNKYMRSKSENIYIKCIIIITRAENSVSDSEVNVN